MILFWLCCNSCLLVIDYGSVLFMQCLPVSIDVGTETESIRNDVAYIGLKRPRDRSILYDELIEEFFNACQDAYGPNVLIQVGRINIFSVYFYYHVTSFLYCLFL